MRIVAPNRRDIDDLSVAIESFDGSFGAVDALGQCRLTEHGLLWMMMPIESEAASELWKFVGVNTGHESSYKTMMESSERIIYIQVVKALRGVFRRERWVGNVVLLSDTGQIDIGSVGGDSQSAMWQHFRQFLELDAGIYHGTIAALEGDDSKMRGAP